MESLEFLANTVVLGTIPSQEEVFLGMGQLLPLYLSTLESSEIPRLLAKLFPEPVCGASYSGAEVEIEIVVHVITEANLTGRRIGPGAGHICRQSRSLYH